MFANEGTHHIFNVFLSLSSSPPIVLYPITPSHHDHPSFPKFGAVSWILFTVQHVYEDHSWENVKLVFVLKWLLFGGSVSVTHNINSCLFKKIGYLSRVLL